MSQFDRWVGARIAGQRRVKELTQFQCAERSGLTVSQLRRVEDTGHVLASELVRLGRVLGKNPGWFVRPVSQPVQQPRFDWD